jgi:hypothetical protein
VVPRGLVGGDLLVGYRRISVAVQVRDAALAVFPEGDLLAALLGPEQQRLDLDPTLLGDLEVQREVPSCGRYAAEDLRLLSSVSDTDGIFLLSFNRCHSG